MVFVLSSFLDNIAAALIGGAMAHQLFRAKVHIGYLAAIVAASNAGGSGSVIGDTTTTMMWLAGVSPLAVLEAYVAATVALVVCGIPAAKQQHALFADDPARARAHARRLGAASASSRSSWSARSPRTWRMNLRFHAIDRRVSVHRRRRLGRDPGLGSAAAARLGGPARDLQGHGLPAGAGDRCVDDAGGHLPLASWQVALGLGFVSAVFDNIPLTALALKQGGYDWGFLAYAVGFGGSMIWFGSSAGVALSNQFPEARSVVAWLRGGWHVAVAYVVGFFVLLAVLGWHPDR